MAKEAAFFAAAAPADGSSFSSSSSTTWNLKDDDTNGTAYLKLTELVDVKLEEELQAASFSLLLHDDDFLSAAAAGQHHHHDYDFNFSELTPFPFNHPLTGADYGEDEITQPDYFFFQPSLNQEHNAAYYDHSSKYYSSSPSSCSSHNHHPIMRLNDLIAKDPDAAFWNELRPITDLENEKKTNDDKPPSSAAATGVITKEVLSRYFYMPITEAAKELNVGLTLLKKMCRELGIKRWPHRKLMSLTALISNVRQLLDESGGGEEGGKLEEAIRVLENERKVLEESPDLQLGSNTKRLRQACFKANYKRKRKHNMMIVSDGDEDARRPTGRRGRRRSRSEDGGASGCGSVAVLESNLGYDDEGEGDEEIRSLLLPVEYDFEF